MSIAKDKLAALGPEGTFAEARRVAREYVLRQRAQGRVSFSEPAEGCLPTVHLCRRTLPEVWEDGIMALLGVGREIHTHYDPKDRQGKFSSFPSVEATVMLQIEEPFGEPRFHKHFLGGWMGFGDYKAEIEGAKDGWMIQPADVTRAIRAGRFDEIRGDERWNYTYSQRLRAYPFYDLRGELHTINQLDSVVENLARDATSRSAQCITWDPRWDHNDGRIGDCRWDSYHSPCLQRFWFRLLPRAGDEGFTLNVNGHWRSRDHLKAVPSNVFGVTEGVHEEVRRKLEARLGRPVRRGAYTDISDSLHLYGHYFDPRLQGLDAESYIEDVFRIAAGEPISERVIAPDTPMYDIMTEDIEREYRFRKENPDHGREV
jgi:thymidylate synthase